MPDLLSVPTSGTLAFAGFAAPPNALGLCGGEDHAALVQHLTVGADGPDLRRLCEGFEGAWPYLRLIADAVGEHDPLARRVVDAYWIGNDLLDAVDPTAMRGDIETRFRSGTPRADWKWLVTKPASGARPHHSFHVLEVLPRAGLLRAGRIQDVLPVMESCLIRPAYVDGIQDGRLLVRARPLVLLGSRLGFGGERREMTAASVPPEVTAKFQPGDMIALHWGWPSAPLTPGASARLERETRRALRLANLTI